VAIQVTKKNHTNSKSKDGGQRMGGQRIEEGEWRIENGLFVQF
jgi:hypothetical protein